MQRCGYKTVSLYPAYGAFLSAKKFQQTTGVGRFVDSAEMKAHDFDSTAKQPATGILTPELSPDGRHIAFVALNQLYEMTIGHRPVALTHTPWAKATPVW